MADYSYRELALQYAQTSYDVYETLLSGGWIYMKDGLLHCKKPIYRYINRMWALQEIVDNGGGNDDIIIPVDSDNHDLPPGLHTALLERSVKVALLLRDGKTPTFPLMIQADKEYRPEELEKLRPQRELEDASKKQDYTLEKLLKTAEQEQITAGQLALLFDLELSWVINYLENALTEPVKGRLLPEVEEAIRAVGCEPQMDWLVGPTILNEAIKVLCNQVGIKP